MPNPTLIHTESTKLRHFLAIADFYIRLGKPEVYQVEPDIDPSYRPDAYTRLPDPVVVEVQRSYISNRKMQEKIDNFADTFVRGKHDAKTLWIVTDTKFTVKLPRGFNIEFLPLKQEA